MWCIAVFFFFKQKTAYEMRISDWSSDVCSSDLRELALRRLDGRVGLAGRHVEPLGIELEVMDQRLHGALHFGATRRRDLAVRRQHGSIRHLLDALPDDPEALPHLLDPHQVEIGRASCRERVWQYV